MRGIGENVFCSFGRVVEVDEGGGVFEEGGDEGEMVVWVKLCYIYWRIEAN